MVSKLRVGTGYDIHPLVPGRRLVLGGMEVPFDRGLDGWSDADVLVHAIIDAMLGAAAMRDIGYHFPPGDPKYKDISSLILLERTRDKLADNGWQISNVDAIIITERPRLSDFIDMMRRRLSQALGISPGQMSVKAKTSSQLGSIGREEGIAAQAVVLIQEI